jgi:hypothetical protein
VAAVARPLVASGVRCEWRVEGGRGRIASGGIRELRRGAAAQPYLGRGLRLSRAEARASQARAAPSEVSVSHCGRGKN